MRTKAALVGLVLGALVASGGVARAENNHHKSAAPHVAAPKAAPHAPKPPAHPKAPHLAAPRGGVSRLEGGVKPASTGTSRPASERTVTTPGRAESTTTAAATGATDPCTRGRRIWERRYAYVAPAWLVRARVGGRGIDLFARLDRNHDGVISREEGQASPMVAKSFDAIDADASGGITRAEWRTWIRARRGKDFPRPTESSSGLGL